MIDNCYIYNGKKYALGGLVNGEIDNLLLSKGPECDIYDIYLDSGNMISLSEEYGLFTGHAHGISAKEVIVADGVLQANNTFATVLKVTKRRGVAINIPKDVFNLNNILITRILVPRIWTFKKTSENETPANLEARKQ